MEQVIKDLVKEFDRFKKEFERVSKRAAVAKNNFAATSAPGVTNDINEGYARGSLWINTSTNNWFGTITPSSSVNGIASFMLLIRLLLTSQ